MNKKYVIVGVLAVFVIMSILSSGILSITYAFGGFSSTVASTVDSITSPPPDTTIMTTTAPVATATYPPGIPLGSHKFQLVNLSKGNQCIDDHGGENDGNIKFHNWECGTKNVNQQWTYDSENQMIINPNKLKCLDDGGGGNNFIHLWECDKNSSNQKWVYDPKTYQLKNPTKDLCYDDGGGSNGKTKAHLWQCQPNNTNQKFIAKLLT